MKLNYKVILFLSSNLVLFILIIILLIMTPISDFLHFFIRFCALFGLTLMVIATIITPFMVQLYKIFGKSFIKIHHIYSILGLVLITLHPILFAIEQTNILVFIPVFFPWIDFWILAGRPALILIYIAVIFALLRKKIPERWRYLHMLNYIALFFGYVHGVLIGTDFQNIGIFIIFTVMIIFSISTFIFKRYLTYMRRKK